MVLSIISFIVGIGIGYLLPYLMMYLEIEIDNKDANGYFVRHVLSEEQYHKYKLEHELWKLKKQHQEDSLDKEMKEWRDVPHPDLEEIEARYTPEEEKRILRKWLLDKERSE